MYELNEDVRKDLYRQVIEIIWRDAPWIFLYIEEMPVAISVDLERIWIRLGGEQLYFFYTHFKS